MGVQRFKLYHYPVTRSARVKWLLHELLDDDFDVEIVKLYAREQHSPSYLEINPNHNVPALEMTMDDGSRTIMLESGAMISMLADAFPEKGLAPPADACSPERALYLHMLHFGGSWVDMMLWQIRSHVHLLTEADRDERTVERYREKFQSEVEPQIAARLEQGDHICGDRFSAADCMMGHNVLWARGYGLCQDEVFSGYASRFTKRPAFVRAFSDMGDFSMAPPDSFREKFVG